MPAEDYDDSLGNRRFAGFCTVYFTITEVTGDRNQTFKYQVRPVSERWTTTYDPFPEMTFVCYGSFTDEDRQTSVYETRTYTRMLWKQNTWEISAANIAMQTGDLSNLSVHGMQMEGYSVYLNSVYFTGTIRQVKPDGTPVRTANDRGAWPQADNHADYYDRFSWQGSLWLCVNEGGTTSTPADGNPDWLKQVDSGSAVSNLGDWHAGLVRPLPGYRADGRQLLAVHGAGRDGQSAAWRHPRQGRRRAAADAGRGERLMATSSPGWSTRTSISWWPATASRVHKGNRAFKVNKVNKVNKVTKVTRGTREIKATRGIRVTRRPGRRRQVRRQPGRLVRGLVRHPTWASCGWAAALGSARCREGRIIRLLASSATRTARALLQTQDGGKTYGYLLTGLRNTDEYVLVAADGEQGLDGCIIRSGEWALGIEWRNDQGLGHLAPLPRCGPGARPGHRHRLARLPLPGHPHLVRPPTPPANPPPTGRSSA